MIPDTGDFYFRCQVTQCTTDVIENENNHPSSEQQTIVNNLSARYPKKLLKTCKKLELSVPNY